MSMVCGIMGLSSAQIAAVRARPRLTNDLARAALDDQMQARIDLAIKRMPLEQRAAIEAKMRASFDAIPEMRDRQAQIVAARAHLGELGPLERALDLQKSWDILHYLFTGHADDADAPGNALMTGESIGDDVGYGPARLQDENATQAFGEFLGTLNLTQLQARVNLPEMRRLGIYSMPIGPGSDAQYEGELRAEVARYFPMLRDYISAMSEKHNGLLIWVS
jgi:Domain of unknown function (DUF1877)